MAAYYDQRQDVIDAIPGDARKSTDAGNLEHAAATVATQDSDIIVGPVDPEIVSTFPPMIRGWCIDIPSLPGRDGTRIRILV